MTKQFKLIPEQFEEVKKKIWTRAVPLISIAAVAGLVMSSGNINDFRILLVMILFMTLLVILGISRGIRRQREIFNSFTFTIEEDSILREQHLTPEVRIPFDEIKEIVKNNEGDFIIKGKASKNQFIIIPSQVEKGIELEENLSVIKEITYRQKQPFLLNFFWVLPMVTLVLMFLVYTSTNKWIVSVAGVILSIGLLYSIFIIQSSKQIDRKTKNSNWLSIIVVLGVITITLAKVFGS